MKILKIIGIGIISLIAIIAIIGLVATKELNYEKSILINAPIDVVWENVNSLADLDKWSPWNDYDPNMKKEITGIDGSIGATSSWESDVENVGSGSQTISNIEAPTLFETDILFLKPFESKSDAFIKLSSQGDKTIVVWGFHSNMPFPSNLVMVFMDMGEMMDKDWDNGLSKLKNICEKQL